MTDAPDKWSFAVQHSRYGADNWVRSLHTYDTPEEAAQAMSGHMVLSIQAGIYVEGRLEKIPIAA